MKAAYTCSLRPYTLVIKFLLPATSVEKHPVLKLLRSPSPLSFRANRQADERREKAGEKKKRSSSIVLDLYSIEDLFLRRFALMRTP